MRLAAVALVLTACGGGDASGLGVVDDAWHCPTGYVGRRAQVDLEAGPDSPARVWAFLCVDETQ
jgi:hypothetical protein